MSTTPRYSLAEYDRKMQQGIFDETQHRRIELIYGELREIPKTTCPHEYIVDLLSQWSCRSTSDEEVCVRVQNSIGLPAWDTALVPDVAWAQPKSYRTERPTAEDVLLVIEVSDSSLLYDQGEKARLYAEAGIADYWIVNVPHWRVEVHRDPVGETYQNVARYNSAETISPLAFPAVSLLVGDLFRP